MSKRKLMVNVSSIKESLAHFKDVWDRAERGEKIKEAPIEILSFTDMRLLMKTLSPRRLELLQKLHQLGKLSIRALAKALARDYSNVHDDVMALCSAGLIKKDAVGKYFMPWDKIVTELSMDVIPERPKRQHASSKLHEAAHYA